MSGIYDRISTGQLAMINGRRAVFLYYASYGGGSGPLWAIEGVRIQFTSEKEIFYREALCRKVSPSVVELELEGGEVVSIPLEAISRYDQFHLDADERFDESSGDFILIDDQWKLALFNARN